MPDTKKWKTKMMVLSTDVEYQGHRRSDGEPYTIYNVTAMGEDGKPIDKRLRTFDGDLPHNDLIEVEVEERKDERHGDTFTISIPGKRTGGGGGGLAGSVDALRKRVNDQDTRIVALEAAVRALAAGDKPQLQSLATPPGDVAAGGATF